MLSLLRGLRPLSLVIAGSILTIALTGTAVAITDTEFRYSTTQQGYLSIHPMDLAPDSDSSASNYFTFWAGETNGVGCYNTGINLPHNATFSDIRVWYHSGADSNIAFQLGRIRLATGAFDALVTRAVADDTNARSSVVETIPSTVGRVSNSAYAYGFGVCLGATTAFHGARIHYTYTTAGD